ncbi:MAG: hypothetical protein WKF55_03255 [Gemmatimonadaceae bacterium]
MRPVRPVSQDPARISRISLVLAMTLLALGATACATDTPNPTAPDIVTSGLVNANDHDAIVVSNSAELIAALAPENAGRRIRVLAGNYSITQPLTVPDGVTLEGEGIMLFDDAGLPTGFATGTGTTLTMTANTPGTVLTLGDHVTVRRIAIVDIAGRAGNVIGVFSRAPGDRIFAAVEEVEIINPNSHTILPSGATGCGLYVLTLNPNLGSDPPPHAGAAITTRLTRSIIRSNPTGIACGLFAFNFAPVAKVTVLAAGNVIGGGIIASGGVSRPDAVQGSVTDIRSRHNLYRNDSPNLCAPQRLGWNAQGGSGAPIPVPIGETRNNTLRIYSLADRIEGFTTGVSAFGGRRFFGPATSGPTTGNSVDLKLIGTTISTPSCGGAAPVADLRLVGAMSTGAFAPGDSNTVRAVIHNVTGSGLRSNVYADVLGPTGPVSPALQGTGNRLEITGSLQAFVQTNRAIDPAPGPAFFANQH